MKLIEKELLKPSIFGMFDGLTTLLGVLIPLLSYEHLLVFFTSVGLSVSSAISMGLGDFLSSDKDSPKKLRIESALYMGIFTGLGCILPVIPFAFVGGTVALVISIMIYLSLTLLVAYLKSADMGWKDSLVQTFAVSLIAVALVIAVTLLLPIPAA
jgi:VIT1/CCC1 family predicted Fe2+/Mn2+ transporter